MEKDQQDLLLLLLMHTVPFSFGSWAPDSLKFMKYLGSRVSEATGEKRAKSFLFQSLSMNLQRGNALCVMGTVAHHRKLEEIYNLGTISTQEE